MASYSRKAYSEAVYRQSTESFIQCLENAFRHLGGVPKRLVIDNLKAAIVKQTRRGRPPAGPQPEKHGVRDQSGSPWSRHHVFRGRFRKCQRSDAGAEM